jgi:hypothetical protein
MGRSHELVAAKQLASDQPTGNNKVLVEYDGGGLHRHVYVADMNRLMWYLMYSDVVIPSKISVVRIDGWDVQENRKSQYSFATVSHGSHFVTVHGMETA